MLSLFVQVVGQSNRSMLFIKVSASV